MPSTRRLGVKGRVGLVLASTVASLLLAEAALRVLSIAPARYVQRRTLETEDKRLALDLYPSDPNDAFPVDLGDEATRASYRARGLDAVDAHFERTPHGVELIFTEELCRGAAIGSESERRALFVGDSFTEGQGVVESETAVRRLAARLPDAELVNCARRGYDFPELFELFERHLELEPDVVVYAMVLNDPQRSESFNAQQQYIDDWIVNRRAMVEDDPGPPPIFVPRLFALLEDRWEAYRVGAATERWYQEMVGDNNADGFAATLEHIERMHAAMEARGGRLLVVLWPLFVALDAYPFAEAHQRIVDELASRGIDVYDTLEAFEGHNAEELWVHAADRHPNADAHAIFADAIEPFVRASLAEVEESAR